MRRFFTLGLFISLAISNLGFAQDAAKPRPLADTFKQLDVDQDGRLSKAEFMKVQDLWKLKPAAAAALFDRLDTNKDGLLTLEEFRNVVSPGRRRQPLAKEQTIPAKPAPPATEKPAATLEKPPTPEDLAFFEKKIRPVLTDKCYKCHSAGAEKLRGNLYLDTREGARRGGDTGPSVVPGNLKQSLLLDAIHHSTEELQMPPKEKLPDSVIADFETWVKMGAPDPREGGVKIVRHEIDIEKGRQFWAYQPIKKPSPPAVTNTAWCMSDIDHFLLAGLEAKGMTPAGDADKATLLRRVFFDLIGLPPTPHQLDAFLQDTSANALEKVVDRLLASPQFGECWGRHWLDVARFAESSGKTANVSYPHAWRYRNYVIGAFNADKPYDRFVREQLAGDLLPAKDDKQKAEQLVATGFLAVGTKNHNEMNPQQFELDLADEQIDATMTAFQGMTVACARCHDHKFDPIPTTDYYSLAGIFRSTTTCYGSIRTLQSQRPSPLLTLPTEAGLSASSLPPLTAVQRASMTKQIADFREKARKAVGVASIGPRNQFQTLQSRLTLYEADGTPKLLAMGVRESAVPADSQVFVRGELDQPGEVVKRGFPRVMTTKQPDIRSGSGRLELANWIASPENPLTARVMVNRVWLHLFGRGIVATPDNFGSTGQRPSNPALLDYLAGSFVENGWSVKNLIRSLVLSRAYGQSSQSVAKNHEVDPDNTLVWRMSPRRLDAEALRDSMLAVSGHLNLEPPKGSPLTGTGDGSVLTTFRFRPIDSYTSETYRSVYIPILRDLLPESLSLFDFPDPTLITGERATTSVPAQSLYLMNSPFVITQADAVAEQLSSPGYSDIERLIHTYKLLLSRPPTEREQSTALRFLDQFSQAVLQEVKSAEKPRQAAWSALCQSLMASAEFCQR